MKASAILMSLVCIACTKSASDASKTTTPGSSSVQVGSYTYSVDAAREVASGTIEALTYEASTHTLAITLAYGGCSDTNHTLLFSEVCATSYPAQCGALITHATGFDASCEALHRETMNVALQETQDEMVLAVVTKEAQAKSVLIDHYGRVKAGTTPP